MNNTLEDAQLVQAFLAGNAQAFNTLVTRWQDRIHYFAYRYFANTDDAADVTQKTFIKAYQKIETLNDHNKFGSWLYRIAKNLCLDELRKTKRQNTISYDNIETTIDATAQSVSSKVETKLTQEIIHKALLKLPGNQRIVIIMKEYEGLTFDEIAEILDEPLSTVKSRLYYGLKRLRTIFEHWNIQKEDFKYE